MKINEIGEDVLFSTLNEGTVLWYMGSFYIKVEGDTNEYNVANIETGRLGHISDTEYVGYYPTASLNLV